MRRDKYDTRALAPLHVIDELEVGAVRVEKRRIVSSYTVTRGKRRDKTDLVFSYEDDVFDPAEPGDRNLAAMITA